MKFDKTFLRKLYENIVEEEIVDHGRWTTTFRRVFSHEGRFYEIYFDRGSTEYQDSRPYEDDEDLIDCDEVEPIEKTVIVYQRVEPPLGVIE